MAKKEVHTDNLHLLRKKCGGGVEKVQGEWSIGAVTVNMAHTGHYLCQEDNVRTD